MATGISENKLASTPQAYSPQDSWSVTISDDSAGHSVSQAAVGLGSVNGRQIQVGSGQLKKLALAAVNPIKAILKGIFSWSRAIVLDTGSLITFAASSANRKLFPPRVQAQVWIDEDPQTRPYG